MKILKNMFYASLGILTTFNAWSADSCNGKNATKVINSDNYTDTIWLYGTSASDVWVIKGNNQAQLMIFFDLEAAHVAVDDAPTGSASGGNDTICINNEKAAVSLYIKGKYKNNIQTKSQNVHLMTNLKDDSGQGYVKFTADYQASSQHNYYIHGSNGKDKITLKVPKSFGFSQIYGHDGDDTITLDKNQHNGGNYVSAGKGNDVIVGSRVNDLLIGGSGENTIYGNDGDDLLIAGDADLDIQNIGSVYSQSSYIYNNGPKVAYEDQIITLTTDATKSKMYGGEGDDVILGSNTRDFIEGNDGDDWLYGYGASDIIHLGSEKFDNGSYCWEMSDHSREGCFNIETETDSDGGIIDGGDGTDTLWGSDGADTITGGKENDRIFGMGGNDQLKRGSCSNSTRNYMYGMGGSDSISYCSGDWVFTASTNGFIAQ